jgi:hypothetical protein
MKRILFAVGCDRYERLAPLTGAEADAGAFFDQLVHRGEDYDASASILLRSPSLEEIRSALSALPFGSGDIDSLTFFFAGHGATKTGAYYLCLRDTDPRRLSTTGLAVTFVLSVMTELRPLQANVLIDACQSGSAMLDSAALLRPDALGLGTPGSLSIAFLAACGPHEYAAETPRGGALTQSILPYIRGDEILQTTRPSLDLIDLGRRVSAYFSKTLDDQVPVTWGINLTGEGRFARNPQYVKLEEVADLTGVHSILRTGSFEEGTRVVLEEHAFTLWSVHQEVEAEADVVSLRNSLGALVVDLEKDEAGIARILRGLATSLRASAVKSSDVFAEVLALYACAEPLLKLLNSAEATEVAQQLLNEAGQAQAQARQWLLAALPGERFCLLSDGNGLADLYYLPLRLSRILGWLAVGLEIDRMGGRSSAIADQEVKLISELIVEEYSPSLLPVSDTQSAFILAWFEAARRRGWTELTEQVIGCYFSGFLDSRGAIASPDLSAKNAFYFVLGLSQGGERVDYRYRANPTQLLPTLLLCGTAQDMDAEWDPEVKRIDHETGYVFVPASFRDFPNSMIENGRNFAFQIGHDVWTLADFRAFWKLNVDDAIRVAARDLSPLAASLALVSSCLRPDRLPLHLLHI